MAERKPPTGLILSDEGSAVIADREGLELTAYWDTAGVLTIGIGHTSAAGPPKVYEGMTITEEEAWKIFRADNVRFRKECIKLVTAPVHQHEFDALASFIFNIGTTQFSGSTVLKRLNALDYAGVPEALSWWNKPPEIIPRRKGEIDQFANGNYVARIP
jgi:lysozyme